MNESKGPAAPASGNHDIPSPSPSLDGRKEEVDDPEIAALLDFEPVPRKINRRDGWTPDLQRRFIRLIVETGTPQRAAAAINKRLSGIEAVYRDDEKGEFRASWDRAVELGRARQLSEVNAQTERRLRYGEVVPAHRRNDFFPHPHSRLGGEGEVLNEFGEWEEEESLDRRAEEAKDSISAKLLRCRRLYLMEISSSPGKRAAFEILTRYPIDWDKAARMEPQDDEPWRKPSMRKPDMLLTAENGWLGELAHGEDKMAELRAAVDEYRASMGLPLADWESESAECKDTAAQPHVDLHERRGASSADGSPGLDPGEPDRRHVGFTPRDEAPPFNSGPRLRSL